MKAIRYHQYGGPEVLRYEEAPIPEVNADEVLIKVTATAFNPADAGIRAGVLSKLLPIEFPFIPNYDVTGVIEKLGDSVKELTLGDHVIGFLDIAKNGAAAEYVVTKADDVVLAPTNIPLQDAAAIPGGAMTAWQSLFYHGNLQPGQRVLITAAAGGVGSFAVQLAKWKGAYVIGTASERSFSHLREIGIDEIIDYKNESIKERVTEKLDVILNFSPLPSEEVTQLLHLLKKGGILVSAAKPADENVANDLGVRTIRIATQRNAEHLTQIVKLVEQGFIKPWITERLPLEELELIHRRVGQTHGRIVIVVNPS